MQDLHEGGRHSEDEEGGTIRCLEWESSRRMESSTVVDGITIDLKARWRIVEICLEIS
ncbi:hypothetical protein A2U01_0106096, partial [Trifolium medium]|nr:hypothetical protein [Trifolium medium]